MQLIFFFRQIAGHRNQRFQAEDSDSVLIVLGELFEDGDDVLDDVVFFEEGGEVAEFHGAGSSDHGGVFVAEVDELFAEFVFVGRAAGVGVPEEVARADPSTEPVSL